LSVVICTRNRAGALARCLRALAELDRPIGFEVIVVDNASHDETADTVASLGRERAWLRYVNEPTIGLSCARNRGAEVASSPLLAYLDDDATAEPGWDRALRLAFAQTDAAIVGGPIVPRFESAPPPTISPVQLGAWSCQDLGAARRRITDFPYLFGANLAVRRDHLERLGGFDERFGRKGNSLLSGEDTDLCERTLAAGGTLVYEPRAIVHHWIPAERVSSAYLRRRAIATGRTRALQMAERLRGPELAAALAGKAAKLPAHLALWALSAALGRPLTAVERKWSVFATLGTLAHFLHGSGKPS
jgi:glycosyltransferase involved in cell wall biosynthesis